MTVSTRLKTLLEEGKIHYTLLSHSPTFTAQEDAAALHVPGKELAKTVVLTGTKGIYVAVLPATHRIDLKKLKEVAGESVRLASEGEVGKLFPDCELGAMPPFGELYGIPVFVDASLAADQQIVFNAGTHQEAIRMAYADFERLVRPRVSSFAVQR
jgi:Ala-tRNA(Pro) deacylase